MYIFFSSNNYAEGVLEPHQERRFKHIGGIERARLVARANYTSERIMKSGNNRFHLATKKGMQWQVREYVIQADSFACNISTPAKLAWSPANGHEAVRKASSHRASVSESITPVRYV